MKDTPVLATLVIAGFAIAFGLAAISHKAEVWDDGRYWTIALPVMAALAGIAGWLRPHRSWSFGVAVVAGTVGQLIVAAFKRGEVPSMWPIGLAFMAALAAGCGAVAWVGSRLRRRSLDRRL